MRVEANMLGHPLTLHNFKQMQKKKMIDLENEGQSDGAQHTEL